VNLYIRNIGQLVTVSAHGAGRKSGAGMNDLGVLTDAAVVCRDGRVTWAGSMQDPDLPDPGDIPVVDVEGRVVLPGFVDSHTHMVFAGSREEEFAQRSRGSTYAEIARAGGGILSTVRATRAASKRDLKRAAARHMAAMLRHGTTTVEVKSGYGLTTPDELKMLEAIGELRDEEMIGVVPTFIGAHAVPPEYAGRAADYVRLVVEEMIPLVGRRRLAEFCDVFCEDGYFGPAESATILTAGKAAGMKLKLHADELGASGGAELAARVGAVSADHLEHVSDAGIAALRESGTVACLLPGVSFFLGHGYAPARRLIDGGAVVAIATDFNPGSCMSYSMPLMLTIACTQMRMTPEEAIAAATLNGAAALGMGDRTGSIEPGKAADLIVADARDYRTLAYHFGVNHITMTVKNGTILEF
jgi:imidazolonepropionase